MGILVPSDPPFNWCHLKLTRAREHMNTIKDEIAAWGKREPYTLVKQYNAEATRLSVILRVTNPPPFEHWALVASDCFHNFRTALDHFIYAIAVFQSGQDPPPDFNRLQFLLCDAPDQFRKEQRRIKSLSDPVRTAIESVQPYNRRHPDLPPLLSLLRDFDDVDKHRLLQVAMAQQAGGQFDKLSGVTTNNFLGMEVHAGRVRDGTEIAALIFNRPSPDVSYKAFRATFRITIRHAPGPQGHTHTRLEDLIAFIDVEVEAVMFEIYKAL